MSRKRQYKGWTCPKCGETYRTPGRHRASCTGKKPATATTSAPAPRRRAAARQADTQVAETVASLLNGYSERVAVFETATADMVSLLKEVMTEMTVYKRDSHELQTMRQTLSAMFERPAVPR